MNSILFWALVAVLAAAFLLPCIHARELFRAGKRVLRLAANPQVQSFVTDDNKQLFEQYVVNAAVAVGTIPYWFINVAVRMIVTALVVYNIEAVASITPIAILASGLIAYALVQTWQDNGNLPGLVMAEFQLASWMYRYLLNTIVEEIDALEKEVDQLPETDEAIKRMEEIHGRVQQLVAAAKNARQQLDRIAVSAKETARYL